MKSFTSVAVLFLSALSAVRSAPIDKRDVPISKCTAIAQGTLRTSTQPSSLSPTPSEFPDHVQRAANGHTMHIVNGKLVYGGSLQVEFQSCQPNFGQFDGNNGAPVGGKPLWLPLFGLVHNFTDQQLVIRPHFCSFGRKVLDGQSE